VSFPRWLRENSEHYLMIDAQRRMAQKYGRPAPPKPRGLVERFWLDVFAPVYRLLPWKVRSKTIQLMPGSHRQQWSRPAERRVPAVGPKGPDPQKVQEAPLLQATPSQTAPETRGE
jgi:hypothetical protein